MAADGVDGVVDKTVRAHHHYGLSPVITGVDGSVAVRVDVSRHGTSSMPSQVFETCSIRSAPLMAPILPDSTAQWDRRWWQELAHGGGDYRAQRATDGISSMNSAPSDTTHDRRRPPLAEPSLIPMGD